ncbi:hydroxyacid dehydrogenase [Levilactobacillus yiduensis]|uniref:hydroxyacid dehydrogenase n=1 Tax=Levilactobacillus yiduensis TaxID=2953880 RepID=UPI000EF321C4|nr:hydroxyacid dehydrogenase [Levilactobacillus yiduensis]AYM01700.1 3-phosphoglycerate dehydrogenase [Levilactobacillus brevis]
MAKIVYIPEDIANVGKKFLKDKGYDVILGTGTDAQTILREGKDAEGIILRTSQFGKDIIDGLPNVQIIARHGVGFDNVDVDAATAAGKWVTNTPLANASSVAETATSLLLAMAKNLKNDITHMADDDFFYKNSHKGMDLEGKTLGIVGYGKIGKMFAKKVQGLDMNILIYDPFISEVETGKLVSRKELLESSDFVSLHLPANAQTKESFGEEEFKLMKKTAYLINLSRGSVVNESALINALESKTIAGAALDVYSQEPLPMNSPLFSLENVTLTPHIASNTGETMDRMALHAAMEVDRVLSGNEPKWAVNQVLAKN